MQWLSELKVLVSMISRQPQSRRCGSGDHLRLAEDQRVIVCLSGRRASRQSAANLLHVSVKLWIARLPIPPSSTRNLRSFKHCAPGCSFNFCCSHSLRPALHVTSHTGRSVLARKERTTAAYETCSAPPTSVALPDGGAKRLISHTNYFGVTKRRPDKRESAIEHPVMSLIHVSSGNSCIIIE